MPKCFSSAPVWRVSSAAINAQVPQRVARARAEIAQIADRRRHHVEPTRGPRLSLYSPPAIPHGDRGMQGMAAISRRPRPMLCALLAALSPHRCSQPACSLVKPEETAADHAGSSAQRLVAEGKHADAARAYARARGCKRRRSTTTTSC